MQYVDTLLAAAPILVVSTLLVLKTGSFRAAVIALSVTACLTVFWFPVEIAAVERIVPSLSSTTLAVIVIIFAGIILAELLNASGSQTILATWLRTATREPANAMLLVGLGISPFAETIIGWGLGVIISVPLLVRIGYSTKISASIGLLGIFLGPWGSLAPGILIMSQLGNTDFGEQGVWTALISLPCMLVMAAAILFVGLGPRGAINMAASTAGTIFIMWVMLVLTNMVLGPPLAGVFSSLSAMVVILLRSKIKHGRPIGLDATVVRALSPYIFLCVGLLLMSLVAKILPSSTLLDILTGPAFWLTLTVLSSPYLLKVGGTKLAAAWRMGFKRALPVAATTTLFLVFGGLLSVNGMSAQLAETAAGLGSGFVLLIPIVGFLGGYITGSNSASAAMFAPGFSETASVLNIESSRVLGILNVSASAAVMASPPRVALAIGLAQPSETGSNVPRQTDERTASVTRVVFLANLVLAGFLACGALVLVWP